jgi:hypothetical protein
MVLLLVGLVALGKKEVRGDGEASRPNLPACRDVS